MMKLNFWITFTSYIFRYIEVPQEAMKIGDVSWHHGWLLHSTNGNEVFS